MLVDALANPLPPGATESTVLGPFYVPGAPLREYGEPTWPRSRRAMPAWVHGRVLDTDGAPIAGAELDVWQNGDDRLYAVQRPEAPEDHLRGRFRRAMTAATRSSPSGRCRTRSPTTGRSATCSSATGRHPWRPAHIHMIVRAPGHRTVATHIFDADSEYLDSDAVFAVKPSLLRDFVAHEPAIPERPAGVDGDWVSVENDLVLARDDDPREPRDPGRTA